ncbi:MAG: hypothetical protein EWV40_08570 [Microcystis flos-aquae Mf_WU_F_19750830_S460]|uniref:Uncharacterized protein n=1 Tax=Microcystis flos-aquae Mf_WU_F_19750830_S460 TaxID=2486237 RepID=A0A552LSU8_9CHRO|nr:MAG: hypothetical protein EWV40_08570 [Microcystis flos-aquae Mf_WU_F_19750830_S460]
MYDFFPRSTLLLKYLSKINYTYLTPPLPLASCLLPFFTRKFILHDYLTYLILARFYFSSNLIIT